LYTALSAPESLVSNPTIYGVNSNTYVLPKDAIVELTIVNTDGGAHPFHLHSHNFQVIARSGPAPGETVLIVSSGISPPTVPMRRDTILINAGGYAIIRFKADNPGITLFLFHCHIEWHVEAGLTATFIEAPMELRRMVLEIPRNHKKNCRNLGIKMKGTQMATREIGWI
jgi:iron transport multicopper oxidase